MKQILTIIMLIALLLSGCTSSNVVDYEPSKGNGHKISVLVSILPQIEFVEKVGGDYVEVTPLIPPGGSPATYDPTPKELSAIENADIYFRIGNIPFEKAHLETIQSINPDLIIVDTSENVPLRHFEEDEDHLHEPTDDNQDEEQESVDAQCQELGGEWLAQYNECEGLSGMHCRLLEGEYRECESACRHIQGASFCTDACVQVCVFPDEIVNPHLYEQQDETEEKVHLNEGADPHIWLSPVLVMTQVQTIESALSKYDPKHAPIYRKNANAYREELESLDGYLSSVLAPLQGKTLLVFHPSWGYFADRYGLEQVAIEQSGKEPTPAFLDRVIAHAKEENIKVIFVQKQFSTQSAQAIADEIGGSVVQIDPLAKDYVSNMESIGSSVAEALS